MVGDSLKDKIINKHAQVESSKGGIIIMVTPVPMIDPFRVFMA